MALEQELETYDAHLHSLLESEGKYVVIKGTQILSIYETYEDALQYAYEKCGLEPFMVKKIESPEHSMFFARDITNICL